MNDHCLFVGRATLDLLYRLSSLPTEDTKVYAQQVIHAPGGPATNAALACLRLGTPATLIAPLGSGPWADVVRSALHSAGLPVIDLAANTDYQTPIATALIHTSRSTRTVLNPPRTQTTLPELAAAWPDEWGSVPGIVLTDGFHLAETLPLLRLLHASGARLLLDGGSWKPGTEALAPLLWAAVCSERFNTSHAFSNDENHDRAANNKATFAWFQAQGVKRVALTRGAAPILVVDEGQRYEIAIDNVEAIDTLGAGDVLHGALCHQLARGASFRHALNAASGTATRACTRIGLDLID